MRAAQSAGRPRAHSLGIHHHSVKRSRAGLERMVESATVAPAELVSHCLVTAELA